MSTTEKKAKAINEIRKKIDALDQELQQRINERARLAGQMGEEKRRFLEPGGDAKEPATAFYDPARENQVLRRVQERNEGPLKDRDMMAIFRAIMSACLALERPLQVGYLGPEGTFTQQAAYKHFGHAIMVQSQATVAAVFQQVEAEQADYGVVPVENSTEGMVSHTLDNFMDSPLRICGEVELRIRLHLLAAPDTKPEELRCVYAHQMALAQCSRWLAKHHPQVEQMAVSSNAEAARRAAQEPAAAAVAGAALKELYALRSLGENIEDRGDNSTRFLVIGHHDVAPSGHDKSSLIVSTRNIPGALFHLLEPFSRENVQLTRIDTRPSRRETWAYVFFMEFEGHLQEEPIVRIVQELEQNSLMVKLLGSYPRAVL